MFKTFELEKTKTGVVTLSLNRPDVRNAFNEVMIDDLYRFFSKDVFESDVRVVVLKGNGAVFCAGGDLNWMRKSIDVSKEENFKDTQKLTQMFAKMNECPKPLVGLVHGAAIGGGVGLVSVCDIVIATKETQFSLSEVRLGIVPACIGPFVISKIGASHARKYFLSAERFLAPEAQRIGLTHEVVDTAEQLKARGDELVSNLLQCGPNALKTAKKLVLDLSWPERREEMTNCLDHVAEVLAELRVTPEGQEGVRAFLEKRKPKWIS